MINFLSLIGYATHKKFKMEMVFDLKDTYFWIPTNSFSEPYLCTALEGKVCQFKVICLGLSTAPLVFTSLFFVVKEGS